MLKKNFQPVQSFLPFPIPNQCIQSPKVFFSALVSGSSRTTMRVSDLQVAFSHLGLLPLMTWTVRGGVSSGYPSGLFYTYGLFDNKILPNRYKTLKIQAP